MSKNMQQWIAHAKRHQKCYYFYEGKVLDLTKFMFVHPGGRQVLQRFCFKDITDIIWTVFPHKKTETLMALQKYIIGNVSNSKQAKKRYSQQVSCSIKEHINFNKNNRKSISFVANNPFINLAINEQNTQNSTTEFSKKSISQSNKSVGNQKLNKVESNQIISQELTQQIDRRKQISKRIFQIKVKSSKDNMKNYLQSQQQLNGSTIYQDDQEDQHTSKVPVLEIRQLRLP